MNKPKTAAQRKKEMAEKADGVDFASFAGNAAKATKVQPVIPAVSGEETAPSSPVDEIVAEPVDAPKPSPARRGRSPKRASQNDLDERRKQRDAELEKELASYNTSLNELQPRGSKPPGSTFRTTMDLTPKEKAQVLRATKARPDLFEGSLVGFVRHFAQHWETYVEALETHGGPPSPSQ